MPAFTSKPSRGLRQATTMSARPCAPLQSRELVASRNYEPSRLYNPRVETYGCAELDHSASDHADNRLSQQHRPSRGFFAARTASLPRPASLRSSLRGLLSVRSRGRLIVATSWLAQPRKFRVLYLAHLRSIRLTSPQGRKLYTHFRTIVVRWSFI